MRLSQQCVSNFVVFGVPGRVGHVTLQVPLGPWARTSWPNISSPDRPWRALLGTALPATAEGQPIFKDQVRQLPHFPLLV